MKKIVKKFLTNLYFGKGMMFKMNLKIKDILKATNGILLSGDLEYECENFSKDTRKIKKGDTYLAIKGESFDGNLFWKEIGRAHV